METRFSSLPRAGFLCIAFLIIIIIKYHMVWIYMGSLNKDLERIEIGGTRYM